MSNPRATGLALLLIGVLVLMGNTMDVFPPEAFWAGLLTYPIGGYLFFMGSRRAIRRSERQMARRLSSRLQSSPGQDRARRQAERVVDSNAAQSGIATPEPEPVAPLNELEMGPESDQDDFQVATDVSFPVELQERNSIADQLGKLSKLHEQGIISAEELAVAKAKLLG